MGYFGTFCLDKEKDMIVRFYLDKGNMRYVLSTPNHKTGNLIENFARLCGQPVSKDELGLKIMERMVPHYIDGYNRSVYVFRLRDTKVANIWEDGTIERKASVPAIAKTLMSQTKDYQLDFAKTVVKTYIPASCKFCTDLHTHMNANLEPDILIALGIHHHIAYPLYYIKKLGLRLSERQQEELCAEREKNAERMQGSELEGKYLTRRIDDMTSIDLADLIMHNLGDAAYNMAKIRASLAVMKDGQAVFTDLEKVYLYRYVFTKAKFAEKRVEIGNIEELPDVDVRHALRQMEEDRKGIYAHNTLYQDLLLWIGRTYAKHGIYYVEISDTTLVKKEAAVRMLQEVHDIMPKVTAETGVTLRFLAGIRRIPLTIVKDKIDSGSYLADSLRVLRAVAIDPYVAGSDILGEEINDIRELEPMLQEIVKIAGENPGFTIRIHAGENDCLRDNVANSIRCILDNLPAGQPIPKIRIGHGLYTANLKSKKGKQLVSLLRETGTVLEFQISSNVRLNNLSVVSQHPLKQYLAAGVKCVQGTDGGALYGTDSIDEQLSLQKLLDLSDEDMCHMRASEEEVRMVAMQDMASKMKRLEELCKDKTFVQLYQEREAEEIEIPEELIYSAEKNITTKVLKDQIVDLDPERLPIVVAGGSFNNDTHMTKMREEEKAILDRVINAADPEQYFFVIGHTLTGYEKYVMEKCKGRFDVYAIVPALLKDREVEKLRKSGVKIRPSIEPEPMAVYKSFNYEIFKRRRYVLIALDGNSAAVNMIQEAKNGKAKHGIYISTHSRMLRDKAGSLQGYVRLLKSAADAEDIVNGMFLYSKKMEND